MGISGCQVRDKHLRGSHYRGKTMDCISNNITPDRVMQEPNAKMNRIFHDNDSLDVYPRTLFCVLLYMYLSKISVT